jgi:pilus assembly protein CpaC
MGVFSGHNFDLSVTIEALENKGLLRSLAEPNLVALSGQTASFLAGGEFPVPVAQGSSNAGTAISVEFKDFGVGLGFTPTVIGRDLINLSLNSEVSTLDKPNGVNLDNFVIPALKVRRAKTVVDLHDGESFAIAGLMQDDFNDAVAQVPGLGSLPIIGALFRSTDFQHNQTELAVFITVHLVQPRVEKDLAAPTDTTREPSPLGLFGMGDTQSQAPAKPASNVPHGEVMP